tara:strand:- start:393 stop:1007 length:615 start_codon:yes stop_codon:yes gene_type:complete
MAYPTLTGPNLYHAYLIDLELAGTTYYMSDLPTDVSFDSGSGTNTYQGLGYLVDVGQLEADISPGEVATSIIVSGLDPSSGSNLKTIALQNNAKGGKVVITRGLSETSIADIGTSGKFYPAYRGVVRNINFSETFPQSGNDHTDTVIFELSNLFGVKRTESRGRKTNPDDFNDYYRFTLGLSRDPIMDRVSALNGKKFAFGKTG